MEVLMIQCDNPVCKNIGTPEYVPKTKRKSDKLIGPYGWLQGDGWFVGSGPAYAYMACSTECVGPAIEEIVRRIHEAEDSMYR